MWFFVISIFAVVIFNHSPCSGDLNPPKYWPTALIHHPKLALDYAVKTQTYPDRKYFEKFASLSKAERKEECRNYLVDAISFSIPPDKTDYIEDDFESLVEETYKSVADPYTERLSFRTVEGNRVAPAHVCIEKDGHGQSWAVSVGRHEGVSIVFRKPVDSSEYQLFGLLEEMPNIDPKLTQRQLDVLYTTGETDILNPYLTNALNPDAIDFALSPEELDASAKLNTADNSSQDRIDHTLKPEGTIDSSSKLEAEDEQKRDVTDNLKPGLRNPAKRQSTRSLCSLNEFERFRVCAVGYLAWKHSKIEYPDYNEGNYVAQNISRGQFRCIEGKIVIDVGTQNDSSSLPVDSKSVERKPFFVKADILPCSINMRSKYAEFFLTSDPFSSDSMFSVEAHWKQKVPRGYHLIGDEIIAFELELHMSNVRVLKPW